jgi:predicted benzoate:H+ symporter BenE
MVDWQGWANPVCNSVMETGFPAYFRRAIVVAFWVLPGLCAFYFIWRHCVPVPFWDEWNTPGAQLASWYRGDFSFAELWSQPSDALTPTTHSLHP